MARGRCGGGRAAPTREATRWAIVAHGSILSAATEVPTEAHRASSEETRSLEARPGDRRCAHRDHLARRRTGRARERVEALRGATLRDSSDGSATEGVTVPAQRLRSCDRRVQPKQSPPHASSGGPCAPIAPRLIPVPGSMSSKPAQRPRSCDMLIPLFGLRGDSRGHLHTRSAAPRSTCRAGSVGSGLWHVPRGCSSRRRAGPLDDPGIFAAPRT